MRQPDIGTTANTVVEGGVAAVNSLGISHILAVGLACQASPNRTCGRVALIPRRLHAISSLNQYRLFGRRESMKDIPRGVRVQENIVRYTWASICLSFLCGRLRVLCRDACHSGCCNSGHTTQDFLHDCLSWIRPCGSRMASCLGSEGTLPLQAYELISAPICDSRWKGRQIDTRLCNDLMRVGEVFDRRLTDAPTESFLNDRLHETEHFPKKTLHRVLQNPLRASKFLVLAY